MQRLDKIDVYAQGLFALNSIFVAKADTYKLTVNSRNVSVIRKNFFE